VLSVICYDPLVTEELLKPFATSEMPRISIIRPDYAEEARESRPGSILATGRAVDLTYPIMACRRLKNTAKWATRLSWIALLSAVIVLALCLGFGAMSHVSSLMLLLWQLLWAGAAWLCVRKELNSRHLTMSNVK